MIKKQINKYNGYLKYGEKIFVKWIFYIIFELMFFKDSPDI